MLCAMLCTVRTRSFIIMCFVKCLVVSGCKYVLEGHTSFPSFLKPSLYSVAIYSDVISLTADQLNTVRVVRRSRGPDVTPHISFPGNHPRKLVARTGHRDHTL